jgi:UDP-GlcNAc:undecaprenyl-phosphate/decaprenyl-phosphate GlcNAc-1-phosphate transferase
MSSFEALFLAHPQLAVVFSFGIALGFTPLVIVAAHRAGWLAYPRSDRWHSRVVALMGGVAIVGTMITMVLLDGAWRSSPLAPALFVGIVVLAVLGAVDDRGGVNPRPKLLIETAVAIGVMVAGVRFAPAMPALFSVPLTIVWLVGVTNAMNLLDNMDGLAGGAGVAIGAGIGMLALAGGDAPLALLSFGLSGACLGYLPYNYRRAKVFMGDTGSLPLGFAVATLSLAAAPHASRMTGSDWWGAFVPLFLCALPLLDTTLVTISRIQSGRAVSQGGRDHASHRLVYVGFGDTGAVLTLHVVAVSFAVCALVGTFIPTVLWITAGLGAICLSLAFIYFLGINPYGRDAAQGRIEDEADAIAHIEPLVLARASEGAVPENSIPAPRRAAVARRAN